jgi:phage terminase large subunit
VSLDKESMKRLAVWYDSPVKFVKECLGVTSIEKWQASTMNDIRLDDRVAVKSGHGVGKSALLAWIILWWLLTRFPAKVACTAPTSHQLDDVLWGEISKWYRRMPDGFKDLITVTSDKVFLNAAPNESFCVARTARKEKPEAFQGFHSENMLFIVDEASGVDPIIFEVGEGAMSTEGAKTLLTGNPTRTSGYFYDAFHSMRKWWKTRTVKCTDSTQATDKYVQQMADKWGSDSNVFAVRVLGEFPKDDSDAIIPRNLIESAVGRDIAGSHTDRVVWGLDVARFGSDKTALCKRKGRVITGPIEKWTGKDTMQVAGLVKAQYDKVVDFPAERPSEIMVDSIGIGAGVVDRLREMGLPARGVNVAESASVDMLYSRLRDELWFKARDFFDGKDVSMWKDPATGEGDLELIEQLAAVKYSYTSLGKLKAESKDEMKKRGVQSPDVADAFCLTLAYNSIGSADASWSSALVYPDLGLA